jgi:aminotransferase
LLVLSDEAYERLLFDGRTHQSISTRPGMEERTVVLHSFSKSYAMTGWRVGYAFGPEWVIGPMTKVVGTYTLCAPSVSQRAAVAALRLGSEIVDSMTEAFCARRDQIYKDLKQLPGVKVFKPAGTFYLFPDISEITGDSSQFAFDLLERQQVVVVPGDTFGSSGKGCIRIALTVNRELLSEAIKRIRAFIEGIS